MSENDFGTRNFDYRECKILTFSIDEGDLTKTLGRGFSRSILRFFDVKELSSEDDFISKTIFCIWQKALENGYIAYRFEFDEGGFGSIIAKSKEYTE